MTGERTWFDAAMQAVDEILAVEDAFHGSRDFLLAGELLGTHRQSHIEAGNRAPSSLQAYAMCTSMALELALKSRIGIDGRKHAKTHTYSVLFDQLSAAAQEHVLTVLAFEGTPATVPALRELLKSFDPTFDAWRYLHEHRNADFDPSRMMGVTRGIHASILLIHPEWRPWPGVLP